MKTLFWVIAGFATVLLMYMIVKYKNVKSWWRLNCQDSKGAVDTTRLSKMIALFLFAVYVLFFTGIMTADLFRYWIGESVNFAASIKVIAMAGAVVVGSMLLPVIDYRLKNRSPKNTIGDSQ